jgi:4-diphosphocytidyl-2-C-methyl-D-erythritol kinase
MIEERAPAKVNLALHVTGQRADGYHLLDTLVAFTEAGDRLTFQSSGEDAFTISGRFAEPLLAGGQPKTGNLVVRARDVLRAFAEGSGMTAPAVHIHLDKNLPVASGIGGGSADAAAALRGLMRLWTLDVPAGKLEEIALALGADVPMCLESRPLVARGIGEEIRILGGFPGLHLLLVNPLIEVPTPPIFKSLTHKTNPPLALPLDGASREDWLAALVDARNDLQPPAEIIEGRIAEVLALLQATGPVYARMSGSGATCFGVYPDTTACQAARVALEAVRPEWYLEGTQTV